MTDFIFRGVTPDGKVVEGDKFKTKCNDKPDKYHILIESREVDLTEMYEENVRTDST